MSWQEIEEARMLRKLYWYSFVVRLSLGITGWLLMQLTNIELLQDAIYYEEVGASIANDWLNGRASTWLADARAGTQSPGVYRAGRGGCLHHDVGRARAAVGAGRLFGHHGLCAGTYLPDCQGVRGLTRAPRASAPGWWPSPRPSSSGLGHSTRKA